MDQTLSSTSGANATNPSPEKLDFFEVARSSQPYPITQLLQQLSELRDELNHERQQHKNEHKEMRDKYNADLQLLRDTKDEVERNLKQLQVKYKEDLTRTLKKVEYLEGNWSALQTRASELRSEVDALGVAAAVGQITSNVPLQSENIMDKIYENTVGKELPEWHMEKTGLLHRQKVLEEKLVNQQSDSAQVLQETLDGLESSIVDYYETTKKLVDRKAALEGLQARQKVSISSLALLISMSCRTAFLDCLTDKGDADVDIIVKVDYDAPQSICGHDIASSENHLTAPRSTGGSGATIADPQSSTNDVTMDAQIIGATTGQPHKRTLPKLLDEERNTSSVDHQRRRTGFASYVGLSNSAWHGGATSSTASNGFASAQGDYQANPTLNAPFLVNLGPNFSTTETPLPIVSSQPHALVSQAPSPATESFRSPEVTSDSSAEGDASSRVLHLRSNTQGQSPWKVPVGPRKWQNSAVRKDR